MKNRALKILIITILCLTLLSGCGLIAVKPFSPGQSSAAPDKPTATADIQAAEEGNWQEILRSIPYCGDVASCRMTAKQAIAYAQLIADGIFGRIPVGEGHYDWAASDIIFWDTPYTVWGYSGEYQTDRANVILGDFAGDGNPYLCVLSSLNPETGFDVYYSDGGTARHVYGDETYMGRAYTTFTLDEDGKMIVSTGGSWGAASYSNEKYGFSEGKAVGLYSCYVDYDYSTELMHETINGVESVYTMEEWEQKESENAYDWEETPGASYTPISLRSMVSYLNQYAAAKGSMDAVEVKERSANSKMAEAMLAAMDSELSGSDYDEAYLLDLDKDGIKELVVYNGAQAWLHSWKNGQLQTKDIGWVVGGWVEWWLCQDTVTHETGIEYRCEGGGDFIGGSSTFYYSSHELSIRDIRGTYDGAVTEYYIGGVQVSQAEHGAVRAQNQRIEQLITDLEYGTHVGETRSELMSLLLSER